jgi:uncharacterized protein (DUF433 family)
MDERHDVLKRITADPAIFGGKPIIRGIVAPPESGLPIARR